MEAIAQLGRLEQKSFSTLWDGYATDTEAKAARDAFYKNVRANGGWAKRFVQKGQLKKYESFGVPDGRSCDVYSLHYRMPTAEG